MTLISHFVSFVYKLLQSDPRPLAFREGNGMRRELTGPGVAVAVVMDTTILTVREGETPEAR